MGKLGRGGRKLMLFSKNREKIEAKGGKIRANRENQIETEVGTALQASYARAEVRKLSAKTQYKCESVSPRRLRQVKLKITPPHPWYYTIAG